MKIFHLSDLHIGLKLKKYDMREEQEHIFRQIAEYARIHKPDAVVIAGDIFDKAEPTAAAYEIFDGFIKQLTEAVPEATIMMISGNHDSAARVNLYRSFLSRHNFYMIGMPPSQEDDHIEKVTLSDEFGDINFYLLPFVKPGVIKRIVGTQEDGSLLSYDESLRRLIARENVDTDMRNVLVSHQFYLDNNKDADDIDRMDSEIVAVGNVDRVYADVLDCFDYAALGHIHKPMEVVEGKNYVYCGTPLACSVSEAGQEKAIEVVEFKEKGNIVRSRLKLEPRRQVRVIEGTLDEVLAQKCEDYVKLVLKDCKEMDAIQLRNRIRDAFPYYLEYVRENEETQHYNNHNFATVEIKPYDMCCDFLGDDADEFKDILKDILNTVGEGQ